MWMQWVQMGMAAMSAAKSQQSKADQGGPIGADNDGEAKERLAAEQRRRAKMQNEYGQKNKHIDVMGEPD
jgi:hypothetical protein